MWGVMTIKKYKFIQLLPFLIILLVSCILMFTELFSLDSTMADEAVKTEEVKNSFELVPFFWTVRIVGGFIGLTLIYVSWRKYKAEEEKEIEKSKQKKSQ